jgi:hypothetical protein
MFRTVLSPSQGPEAEAAERLLEKGLAARRGISEKSSRQTYFSSRALPVRKPLFPERFLRFYAVRN